MNGWVNFIDGSQSKIATWDGLNSKGDHTIRRRGRPPGWELSGRARGNTDRLKFDAPTYLDVSKKWKQLQAKSKGISKREKRRPRREWGW